MDFYVCIYPCNYHPDQYLNIEKVKLKKKKSLDGMNSISKDTEVRKHGL